MKKIKTLAVSLLLTAVVVATVVISYNLGVAKSKQATIVDEKRKPLSFDDIPIVTDHNLSSRNRNRLASLIEDSNIATAEKPKGRFSDLAEINEPQKGIRLTDISDAGTVGIPQPKSEAEYDALPSGTVYIYVGLRPSYPFGRTDDVTQMRKTILGWGNDPIIYEPEVVRPLSRSTIICILMLLVIGGLAGIGIIWLLIRKRKIIKLFIKKLFIALYRPKIILWIGILLIVLMCLFPPWVWERGHFAGHAYLFSEGWTLRNAHIDLVRLIIQCVIVGLITGTLLYTLKDKKN
jgi:hypothetical protein